MRKLMVEFLRKFENRAIKIGRDNSIQMTKIDQFKLTLVPIQFIEKSMPEPNPMPPHEPFSIFMRHGTM